MRFAQTALLAGTIAATSLVHLGAAHADSPSCKAIGNGDICTGTVQSVYVTDSAVYVALANDIESQVTNCIPTGSGSDRYFKVVTSASVRDNYVSLFLAAQLGGYNVSVRVNPHTTGAKDTCEIGYAILQ